jgi:hypothetical protein
VQVELSVREGRNRIVRRMMAAAGMPIKQLHRTHVGPLCIRKLELLRPTDATRVPDDDMAALWAALGGDHVWVSRLVNDCGCSRRVSQPTGLLPWVLPGALLQPENAH